MLSVGSPGSPVGLRFAGVGVAATSAVGVGDASGVCGKACSPASGVESGVGVDDASAACGKACGAAIGLETGDAAGTSPPRGDNEIAVRHPTAMRRRLTGTNLLVGILIQ